MEINKLETYFATENINLSEGCKHAYNYVLNVLGNLNYEWDAE